MNKKTLLVIAAHPDDEVLGCAATVASKVKQGFKAHLLIMTGGITGRNSSHDKTASTVAAQGKLSDEMKAAADAVGYTSVTALDFPDNRMDTVGRQDLTRAIIETLRKIQPEIIFTHHPGDYNWDHTAVFDAVMMAARSSPGEFAPRELLTFEVASSTERAWQEGGRAFMPNVYVDIAETIDVKKKALAFYKTEIRDYPHPRSERGIENLARKRGNDVGLEFAEAFHLVRRIE